MYIYLRKLKKVKDPKKKGSKPRIKPENKMDLPAPPIKQLYPYQDDEQLIDDPQFDPIDTASYEEQLISEATQEQEIQVLTADDVQSHLEDTQPSPAIVTGPVLKSPTGGLIYLQKLKKVKKEKRMKVKSPEKNKTLKTFSRIQRT